MNERLKICKALGDETRLNIIELLLQGEKCVCEIVPLTKRTQSTISLQLAKLEHLGIVASRREGKRVYYSVSNPKIKRILKILNESETHV